MERTQQAVIDLKTVESETSELDGLVSALESPRASTPAPFVASGIAKCGPKPPA